ncbi:MAG: GrpB family protein [Burkholderiales bacterium]
MNISNSEDQPIAVVPYSAAWPALFASEVLILRAALEPWLVADMEHVGSTAVVGLSAKPIIDIMAPVHDLASSRAAIAAAQSVGYCHYPYKPEQMHWFCKPSPAARTHHLHLIPWGSALWQERLAFRDALRNNFSLAQQYGMLKQDLAARHPLDREAYTEAKTPFITSVLNAWRRESPSAT